MSLTEAGPYPLAEDQPQATPDGANPLEEGLGATRCYALRAGLFRELS